MNNYKLLLFLLISPTFLLAMSKTIDPIVRIRKKDLVEKKSPGCKQVGKFFFTAHAQERMQLRGISFKEATDTISHGNRYNTLTSHKLCYKAGDLKKSKIAVIFDDSSNTVITVLNRFTQKKLKDFIEKRDEAKKVKFNKKKHILTQEYEQYENDEK